MELVASIGFTPNCCRAPFHPTRGALESSCPRGTSGICPPFLLLTPLFRSQSLIL